MRPMSEHQLLREAINRIDRIPTDQWSGPYQRGYVDGLCKAMETLRRMMDDNEPSGAASGAKSKWIHPDPAKTDAEPGCLGYEVDE